MQKTRVWSLSREGRSLEKEIATHSSILAWRIPRTEKPGGLQSLGSQRVRYDRATNTTQKLGRQGWDLGPALSDAVGQDWAGTAFEALPSLRRGPEELSPSQYRKVNRKLTCFWLCEGKFHVTTRGLETEDSFQSVASGRQDMCCPSSMVVHRCLSLAFSATWQIAQTPVVGVPEWGLESCEGTATGLCSSPTCPLFPPTLWLHLYLLSSLHRPSLDFTANVAKTVRVEDI